MSRTLSLGTQRFTRVLCLDEPGSGGACHQYEIHTVVDESENHCVGRVQFQNGPWKETSIINGCYNEDLIAILVDRLDGFQSDKFACEENAKAREHLLEALFWLNHRTNKRQKRGVEGTLQQ